VVPFLAWRWIDESPFFIAMKAAKPRDYTAKPFILLFKHCKHSLCTRQKKQKSLLKQRHNSNF
jgi:hypothetical protein